MAFSLKLFPAPLSMRGVQALRHCVLPTIQEKQLQSLTRCVHFLRPTTQKWNVPTRPPCTLTHSRQYTAVTRPFKYDNNQLSNSLKMKLATGPHLLTRTVTKFSKKGKRKTVKAVAKRFYRTGSGKLKYWPAGNVHNMLAKSRKRRLQLRKAKYVSKTQLKTLNKMISGW